MLVFNGVNCGPHYRVTQEKFGTIYPKQCSDNLSLINIGSYCTFIVFPTTLDEVWVVDNSTTMHANSMSISWSKSE